MAAEYDVPYKILRGRIHGALERYEAYMQAQKLTIENERVVGFQSNRTQSNLPKYLVIVIFCIPLEYIAYTLVMEYIRDLRTSLANSLWVDYS